MCKNINEVYTSEDMAELRDLAYQSGYDNGHSDGIKGFFFATLLVGVVLLFCIVFR